MRKILAPSFICFFVILGLLIGLVPSCVTQTPVPQYAESIIYNTVYTHDDVQAQTSSAVSDSVASSLDGVLSARRLGVKQIPFDSVKSQIEAIRDTDRRLQALKSAASGAQFILLTEISTEFYSPLSGRYRWNVHVNMAIMDLSTGSILKESNTIPAVLMYSHEDGNDAIKSVLSEIQREMGSLVDKFMRGRTVGKNISSESPGGAPPLVAAQNDSNEKKAEAIYFILVDRFFNAQKDNDFDVDASDPAGWHGGDIKGIIEKLPYLNKLGITKIWLSPVFTAAHEKFFGNGAFHGYWTYDLNTIDSHFGSEADLKKLAMEAEKYHIGLILDLVVNHVGYGSPLLKEKPDWFHPSLTIEDWNDLDQLTRREVHGLPDLDQDNPEVHNYIMKAADKWLDLPNIAGYRLDAVKHVGLDYWTRFNTELSQKHQNLILLGEYFDGDPRKVDEVQKQGKFTHLFDFPLAFALRDVFCTGRSLATLASIPDNDRQYSHPNQMVTFIDNHDMPRFISHCQGNKIDMQDALTILLTWRGVPSLYYGTEYPLYGDKEPENRADMQFSGAKFEKIIPRMLRIRSKYPVFAEGKTGVLSYQPGFAVFARELNQEQGLVIVSRLNSVQKYELPEGIWMDADNSKNYSNTIEIAPNQVRIFVRQNAKSSLLISGRKTVKVRVPDDGKNYAIVGSCPELGQWNPQKAPRVSGNAELTLELPRQTVIVYKPVRMDGDNVQWSDGDNRELFTERDTEVNVEW